MDETERLYDVAIIGAGIAGMATAVGLYRQGITNIVVLEKATELAPVGASIGIFSNGLRALEYLSPTAAKKARDSCIAVESMIVKDLDGNLIREKKPPTNVYYMVWYLLQQYLAEELPESSQILQLGHAVKSFQEDANGQITIVAHRRSAIDSSNGTVVPKTVTIRARALVGTDGIHSPTRKALFGDDLVKKFYHGKVSFRALLSTDLIENPPRTGLNVTFQGDEPGKIFNFRETAKGLLTITSMARFSEPPPPPQWDIHSGEDGKQGKEEGAASSSPAEDNKAEMQQLFANYPAEVQNLLQQIPAHAVHKDPIQDIDVLPRWSKGPVIVIGDAAHAMSPAMGQGANQGLEDACILVHGLVDVLGKIDGDQDNNESLMASSVAIARSLEEVWQSRVERVKMIHAASRARSISNNQSSISKPIDMTSEELQRIVDEIDNWQPPTLAKDE